MNPNIVIIPRTKGELKVGNERDIGFSFYIESNCLSDGIIATAGCTPVDLANLKHLVKCWDAFEEGGLVGDLLAACKRGHQRLLEMGQKESHRTVNILKEAIAKADKEMKDGTANTRTY